MTTLSALFENFNKRRLPDNGMAARVAAGACWQAFADLLTTDPPLVIYGANTLPGHRMADGTGTDANAINRAIMDSHSIAADPPWLDSSAVGFATLAKLIAVGSGNVPVRPETVDLLVAYFQTGDWAKARVPAAASYSCGDVVPAAHWLRAVLSHSGVSVETLGPGEVMALINGNFIALGATLARLADLPALLARVLANAAWLVDLTHMPREIFAFHRRSLDIAPAMDALNDVAGHDDEPLPVQLPVSIRSIPQLQAMRHRAVAHLARTVMQALAEPSGNPLYDPATGAMLSQSSFLALDVSLALSATMEMLLAQMWACTERCKFLAEHFGEEVGRNPVATIQVVKQMQAQTEAARRAHGIRLFASGGSTSAGVEDLWGYTLPAAQALDDAMGRLDTLIGIEARLLGLWSRRHAEPDTAARHWPNMTEWWAAEPPVHPLAANFAAICKAALES